MLLAVCCYPFISCQRVEAALKTKWGRFFQDYDDGQVVMLGAQKETVIQAVAALTIAAVLTGVLIWLLTGRRTHTYHNWFFQNHTWLSSPAQFHN